MNPTTKRVFTVIAILTVLFAVAALSASGTGNNFPYFLVGIITVIQIIGWVIAAALSTEKFFDALGAVTWFAAAVLALYWHSGEAGWVRLIFAGIVMLWAARLGTFLAIRGLRNGDSRFDEIKKDRLRFLIVWLLQAVWITLTGSAIFTAIMAPNPQSPNLLLVVAGTLVALCGLGVETIADAQKSAFKANPINRGEFIRSGLWARSQHPNYFGEILVWLGLALASISVLQGWSLLLAAISPTFITLLLTKVSGIPMLDQKATERWGNRSDWQEYRRRTPSLIPKIK